MCCGGARRIEIKNFTKRKTDTAGCVGVYKIKKYVMVLFKNIMFHF